MPLAAPWGTHLALIQASAREGRVLDMAGKLQFAREFVWPIGVTLVGGILAGYGAVSTAHDLYTAGLGPHGWILVGIAVMFAGLILAMYKVMQHSERVAAALSAAPGAHTAASSRTRLAQRYFQNEEVRLVDLLPRGSWARVSCSST